MEEKLENIIQQTGRLITSKVSIGVLAVGLAFGYAGCEMPETPEEKCCSCLVDNGCTSVSKSRCDDAFYDGGSFSVSGDCVRENSCWAPCAEAGAYFN